MKISMRTNYGSSVIKYSQFCKVKITVIKLINNWYWNISRLFQIWFCIIKCNKQTIAIGKTCYRLIHFILSGYICTNVLYIYVGADKVNVEILIHDITSSVGIRRTKAQEGLGVHLYLKPITFKYGVKQYSKISMVEFWYQYLVN